MAAPSEVTTTWPATISAAGEENGVLIQLANNTPSPPATLNVGVSGTYSGTLTVRGRLAGMTTFFFLAGVDLGTSAAVNTGGSIALADNTAYSFRFPVVGFDQIEVYAPTLSGSMTIEQSTSAASVVSPPIVNATTTATNLAAATTVTVASANALAVGPNGTTNPTLQVSTNTASAATGLKVTSAAAAGGVAVAAISSGTNEPLTVDAKGSGTVSVGTTSTGPVYLARGSLKAPIVGQTVTSLGTTQNSTPTAAQLLGGILTQTGSTGAGTFTLPSGTTLSAALALTQATGDSFECLFANLGGGQTITITGATGTTVLGTAAVPTGKFATMRFVNTGTNAWNIYCVVSA